jgi:dihydroflavonol-4-reductase
MTSSVASVRGSREVTDANPLTEDDWTDGADTTKSPYVRSKATAERAAWELMKEAGAEEKLTTICPGAIIGPALSDDTSFSLQVVERLIGGGTPAIPRLGFSFVDVRDVAEMHVLAMTDPAAGGQRFIATDRFLWMSDVAEILKERLGSRAKKVPSRQAPNFLIKVIGIFDPGARSIVGDLGKRSVYSSEKARTTLGWEPMPVEDSIVDTAESLIQHGVVKTG